MIPFFLSMWVRDQVIIFRTVAELIFLLWARGSHHNWPGATWQSCGDLASQVFDLFFFSLFLFFFFSFLFIFMKYLYWAVDYCKPFPKTCRAHRWGIYLFFFFFFFFWWFGSVFLIDANLPVCFFAFLMFFGTRSLNVDSQIFMLLLALRNWV